MSRTALGLLGATLAMVLVGLPETPIADESPPIEQSGLKALEDSQRELARRAAHEEVPRDPYIHVPDEERATSPAVPWVRDGYVSVQVNVDSGGYNILGDAANEPSIAVDPTNPSRMAVGWRQFDTVASDFRQAGWGYTTDGGYTWTFPGVIEPGVFRSDPVLDANAQGDFFYNSLTRTGPGTGYSCNVYKSTDGGASWDEGVYAYGGDKQWMTIDRTGGIGHDNVYANWTKWYTCPGCSGHFTRSYDGGQTFLPTIDVPGNPHWGTLAVGPDGELYVAGEDGAGLLVAKSSTMQDESLPVAWDLSTTVDLDGGLAYSTGPNPAGLLGQLWVAVDHSDGPTRGNVYVLSSVERSSIPDPLDVMFARSTDGGLTWSDPVRVNDDPSDSNYQWFGTMSVAPNGRIDVIFNDTRNDPGGYDSELYYSYSEDAGMTWSVNEALSPPFDPHLGWPQQNKIGDYYDMVSDDMGANVAYAATFNGEQDVYYLRIGSTCSDAGTVALDPSKYACEDTATVTVVDCGLNLDDETIEFAIAEIDSDSEPGGETVVLTETGPATADFRGTIALSTTNSSGVLQVAEGDTVTATYIDADDGQGGINVVVTDSATVDCTAPVISNVQTTNIQAHSATVTFDTDEPANGAVDCGTSCGALAECAAEGGYVTAHSLNLSGLTTNTTYYYAVDAADEAGNSSTDDNGGACYTFDTPDVPDYFTELFTGDFDLDGLSLTFIPDGSPDFYSGCVEPIASLPVDPSGGAALPLSDDDYEMVTQVVSLYGTDYSQFYVGSNGYITFTAGDTDYTESLTDHFEQPRISALFDDLNPSSGGTVSWKLLADRVVVTWEDVPQYGSSDSNTFQVEMHFNGTIVISFLGIGAADGLVGLSEGFGVPPGFIESDLSAMGPCLCLGDDTDGDGILDDGDCSGIVGDYPCPHAVTTDCDDNCTFRWNPDQSDVSGDGVGDVCQCADMNGDGLIDGADLTLYRRYFGGLPSPFSLDRCGVSPAPDGGACDGADLTVILRSFGGLSPGITNTCSAYMGP